MITAEILQFWAVVGTLFVTTVVAVVAQRRRADPRWERVSTIAAVALAGEFILTLVWIRFVVSSWRF